MIKQIKYIVLDIINSIRHDLFSSWNDLDKPKELMSLLFYIAVIQVITNKLSMLPVTIALYVIAYIWKVIRRGEWKHRMREDYKKL